MFQVHVKDNLVVTDQINDISLADFAEDVVLVTNDAFIEATTIFLQPVYVNAEVDIKESLETLYLMGIDTREWINNALFIDNGLIPGMLLGTSNCSIFGV